MANGATDIASPINNKELNSKPPDASPNLFINVSIKTEDLYFSDFLSVV